MTMPGQVKGAGNNSVAQNVISVTFSQATSDIPTLEAWDDFNTNSILHEIFTGTVGNGNIPILSAVATTDGAPVAAWKPAAPSAGGATINRLMGSTNYVNLAAAPITLGNSVRFNLCWEVPYDASVPADMDCVFAIRYSYSGAPPVLTWEFNDEDAGGTEGVPVWTGITPGVAGNIFRPTDAGVTAGNLVLHKPPASTIDNPELWIDTP